MFAAANLLIRTTLREPPSEDLTRFWEQYAEALWLEERAVDRMAAAIGKALGG